MFPEPQGDLKDRVLLTGKSQPTQPSLHAHYACGLFYSRALTVTLIVSEATFCCLS